MIQTPSANAVAGARKRLGTTLDRRGAARRSTALGTGGAPHGDGRGGGRIGGAALDRSDRR